MGLVVLLLERSNRRWFMLPVLLVAVMGLVINNRRLAIVGLLANVALIYLVLPRSQLKRSITRNILILLPLVGIYVAVGWQSNSAVFGPVRMLSSVLSKDDRSSGTRDIEKLQPHPDAQGQTHPRMGLRP